jgi:PAS domain S-box-containing protein
MPNGRILITEDEIVVAEDLRCTLTNLGYHVTGIASSKAEALALTASTQPDLVLMDIQLKGDGDGISAAAEINERHQLPVVFLTAHADQATLARATETMPFGYLLKPFEEQGVVASIETAMRLHETQAALSRVERWLATTLRSIGDAVISTDLEGRVTFLNPCAEQITGWSRKEAIGRRFNEVFRLIHEDTREPLETPVERALALGVQVNIAGRTLLVTRTGQELSIDDSAAPLREADGRVSGVVIVFRDTSDARREAAERERLLQRMLEAQRLESLGLVAGGVAHDFNNLLTAIIGNAELARTSLPKDAEAVPFLAGIEEASTRAAGLCQHMLAYAGRQQTELEPLDLNSLVHTTLQLLRSSLDAKAELVLQLEPHLPPIQADRTHVQQVTLNLILNAAEALCSQPGVVTISTHPITVDREALQKAALGDDFAPGTYIAFEVRDTGSGMSAETMGKIFDPFFTTKFTGRGLGLASVHGIARTHKAPVFVRSKLGFGTVFTILLPVAEEEIAPVLTERKRPRFHGEGAVLIVEDEPTVLFIMSRIVERLGFQSITAPHGQAALATLAASSVKPRLILLDVNMPGLDGVATLRELRRMQPDTPVILVSALPEDAALERFAGEKIAGVVHKPFRPEQLERKIAEVFA